MQRYQGYSNREIAKVINSEERKVGRIYKNALKDIRRMLEDNTFISKDDSEYRPKIKVKKYKVLDEALKQEEKKRNITRKELCKKIGIGETTIQQWQKGDKKPTQRLMNRLMEYFGRDDLFNI
jgi:DNA-binding XRE family transcriptional regulator